MGVMPDSIRNPWPPWIAGLARNDSRVSLFDSMYRQQALHATHGQLGLLQQVGGISQAEQLRQVRQRARALLAAHHGEVGLVAVEPRHEHNPGLVEARGRR